MGFFTSKSETLLQSFVDTLFKGIVNSLLIASVAILVTERVKDSLARSRDREALRTFNNGYLVESAGFLIKSYTNLSCARDTLLVANPGCKTEMSKLVANIDERKTFLTTLFPGRDFSALSKVASALDDLQNVSRDSGGDSQAIKQSIQRLTEQIPIAVNQITQNIE